MVARNDAPVRTRGTLPLETAVLAGEVPESVAIHMNGFNLRADLLGGRRPASFWISARTTSPRPAMLAAARRSIASLPPAASRCTWPASAKTSRPWTAPAPL